MHLSQKGVRGAISRELIERTVGILLFYPGNGTEGSAA